MHMRQHSFNREELLACGRGELFGHDNGRLPLPGMLMLDRIVHIDDQGGRYGHGQVVGELEVHPDLWFFHCHFRNDPIMPGCLGLDGLWQLCGFFLLWKGMRGHGRAFGVDQVRFHNSITPFRDTVRMTVDIRRVKTNGLALITADGAIDCRRNPVTRATGLKVGLLPGAPKKTRPHSS